LFTHRTASTRHDHRTLTDNRLASMLKTRCSSVITSTYSAWVLWVNEFPLDLTHWDWGRVYYQQRLTTGTAISSLNNKLLSGTALHMNAAGNSTVQLPIRAFAMCARIRTKDCFILHNLVSEFTV